MENKYDNLREKGMLCLLAFSPVVIGFFYYVMIQIPVIGTIWMYAAPFTVLYYWGWVGTVFYGKIKQPWKGILLGNLAGIISFLLFIWQAAAVSPEARSFVLNSLSQMFTLPLGFITMWIGLVIEGTSDFQTASDFTVICAQVAGLLFMLVAFSVGYVYSINKAKKLEKSAETEETEIGEGEQIETLFSDKTDETILEEDKH